MGSTVRTTTARPATARSESKGEATRNAILDRAVGVATRVGLSGLTIGTLADELKLSKSGLFAHFQSKEALQVQVIEAAAARFVDDVVRPALTARRGEPRVRALFDRWLDWGIEGLGGPGCFFVATATELDDQPGPARDALVRTQRDWLDTLATAARVAVAEGHFRADLDVEQFVFDEYGILLVTHHASRLLADPKSARRARAAFDALLVRARPAAH